MGSLGIRPPRFRGFGHGNIGALVIRIGFGVFFVPIIITKESPNPYFHYEGPFIHCLRLASKPALLKHADLEMVGSIRSPGFGSDASLGFRV